MKGFSFTRSESEFLSNLNAGYSTYEELKNQFPYSEKVLNRVIESLIAKNIIVYDDKNKIYRYDSPVNGEKIILEGNLLLPTTILRYPNYMIIGRGKWYKFPPDFDIRRIIWNIDLATSKNKCTLVDLIRESVLAEKRTKIKQSDEPMYKKLVNKIVPYSNKLAIKLNVIGDDECDVTLLFRKTISKITDDMKIEFRGLTMKSTIKTEELINELRKAPEQREYKNIQLDTIVKFSDFIFIGNEIPFEFNFAAKTLSYVKITGVKGRLELTYMKMDSSGEEAKLDVAEYSDFKTGMQKLQEHFIAYAKSMIEDCDFMIEGIPDFNSEKEEA